MGDININMNTGDGDNPEPREKRWRQLVPGRKTSHERRSERIMDTARAEGDMIRSTSRWWQTLKDGIGRKGE